MNLLSAVILTTLLLALALTLFIAIAATIARIGGNPYSGRDLISINEEEIESGNLKYVRWDLTDIQIATYIAINYKASIPTSHLIKQLAILMKRPESGLIRKINRIRAIRTGKAPNASVLDKQVFFRISELSAGLQKNTFIDSLISVGTDSGDVEIILSLLDEITPTNSDLIEAIA